MVTIGRDSKNDIVLKDASVADEHASIEAINGNRLIIRDLGTRSGTYLWREDSWTQALLIQLGPQDRIRFGNHEMSWQDLAQTSAGLGLGPVDSKTLRNAGLLLAGKASDKPVFENPKRNPITGSVEERDKKS
jgi:pSer/pThr/pTyr-binding forkhead associated (FHA) protein